MDETTNPMPEEQLPAGEQAPAEGPPLVEGQMEEPVASVGPEFIVGEIEDDLPLLKQIETELVRSIPKVYHAEVDRHVIKGMKIMFDERTSSVIRDAFENLKQAPSESVAMGVAALMSIIDKETKGPLNPETLIPAALILMCQALDFLAKGNKVELTEELVAETTQKLLAYMMQKMNITPEKVEAVKGALAQAQQGGEQGMPPGGAPAPGIVEQQQQQAAPPAPPAPPAGGEGIIGQQQGAMQ